MEAFLIKKEKQGARVYVPSRKSRETLTVQGATFILFYEHRCRAYIYACVPCGIPGAYRSQKMVSDLLELELQMVVSPHTSAGN